MSYPIYLPILGNHLAQEIEEELHRAEIAFPKQTRNVHFIALVEEVGELAKEILTEGSNVKGEAIQVAVMAIRIIKQAEGR